MTPARVRELVDAYRDAGGTGSCVLVRRAWLGEPPRADVDRQIDVYRGYAPASAPAHWGADEMVVAADAAEVARGLARRAATRPAPTRLNLRVHVPGVSVAAAREQIVRLGDEVLPLLRDLRLRSAASGGRCVPPPWRSRAARSCRRAAPRSGDDREPEPGARLRAGRGRPVEAVEHELAFVGRDADAAVAHLDDTTAHLDLDRRVRLR